ncbi:MAG: hypothetical protein ACKV19_20340 [Verrucomicrobiales bacterium]
MGRSVVVEGLYVVGRTADVSLSLQRPTKNFMGIITSGGKIVRVYQGPGPGPAQPSAVLEVPILG